MFLLNKISKFSLITSFLIVVACGDDSGTNGVSNRSPTSAEQCRNADYEVGSFEGLPSCTDKQEGLVGCVQGSNKIYVCEEGEWIHQIDSSSSSKEDDDLEEEDKSSSSRIESSSSSEEENVHSSSSEVEFSSSSGTTVVTWPMAQDESFKTTGLGYRISGDYAKFLGAIRVDTSVDTTVFEDDFRITSIIYDVAKGKYANGEPYASLGDQTIHNELTAPVPIIDLGSTSSLSVKVDLVNNEVIKALGCGDYTLFISVTAVNEDGSKTKTYNDVINFVREEAEFCRVEEASSSSSQAEVAMLPCEVELSTNIFPGVNLATCTAVDAANIATADLVITKSGSVKDPDFTISSNTGVLFAPITNGSDNNYCDDYEVDFWPESMSAEWDASCPGISNKKTAYVSDFKYFVITGLTIENYIANGSSQIYVAKAANYDEVTKKGFFAFGVTKNSSLTNGDVAVILKIYRVQ